MFGLPQNAVCLKIKSQGVMLRCALRMHTQGLMMTAQRRVLLAWFRCRVRNTYFCCRCFRIYILQTQDLECSAPMFDVQDTGCAGRGAPA